jgi:hypothetical protein
MDGVSLLVTFSLFKGDPTSYKPTNLLRHVIKPLKVHTLGLLAYSRLASTEKFSRDKQQVIKFVEEPDFYGRKPKSSLGRVFNFKLGSLTDNTINSLNAKGHF